LQIIRGLALLAVSGGVAGAIWGIVQLSSGQSETYFGRPDYLVEGLRVLAALSQLGGLVALHLSQANAQGYDRLGVAGFSVTLVGGGAILGSAMVPLTTGGPGPAFLLAVQAPLFTIGVLLLAFATFRAAVLPRWAAILVAGLFSVAFGDFGLLVNGVIWIALGYMLLSEEPASNDM
jgi:hypothetical protein